MCKCVLQLGENLTLILGCIACQLCKCVLQIELKRSAICGVILKVGKSVLQLVENLAFMSLFACCINWQKCFAIELKQMQFVAFSGQSDEPAC